jgi:Domain of unknown function (DUF4406)
LPKQKSLMVSRLKNSKNEGKQVYLSGPMRGYEEFNFPAFISAAKELRAKGYKVYDPAEQELEHGFDPKTGLYADGRQVTIRELILEDLVWICQFADKVVVLPGWENSKGAQAEVACARAVGVEVIEFGQVGNG